LEQAGADPAKTQPVRDGEWSYPMLRLKWTDIGLALMLAIPATAVPDTAPRAQTAPEPTAEVDELNR
jgi:hypothetical protein